MDNSMLVMFYNVFFKLLLLLKKMGWSKPKVPCAMSFNSPSDIKECKQNMESIDLLFSVEVGLDFHSLD